MMLLVVSFINEINLIASFINKHFRQVIRHVESKHKIQTNLISFIIHVSM